MTSSGASLARLLDLVAIERELCSRSLADFIRCAWHVLEPRAELVWSMAMDAISDHLEAVSAGEITRLLINVPPGFSKSLQTCVFWPAWEWATRDPALRIIGSSHSEAFATRDTGRMRNLVRSEWYRGRWGDRFALEKTGERHISNDHTGWRQGIPFSSLTGARADRVILDDPHSTEGAESDADRSRAIRIFRESVSTRTSDLQTGAIVAIMQRLHEGDISGEILRHDLGYEHLMLPMEYEADHPHRTRTCIGFKDPRTEDGQLLDPIRFPRQALEGPAGLKTVLGSHATAGQLQQRPSARGGSIVRRSCFDHRFVVRGADPLRIIQSWDTASSTKLTAARSCCLTGAEFRDRLELWGCFSERLRFAQLQQAAVDQAALHSPSVILIEKKSSGESLVQQLEDRTTLPVLAWDPGKLDKDTRLQVETPYLEAGHVHLPASESWVPLFIDRVTSIPTGTDRDEGDALSQMLRYIREDPVMISPARPRVVRKRSNRFGR